MRWNYASVLHAFFHTLSKEIPFEREITQRTEHIRLFLKANVLLSNKQSTTIHFIYERR